MRFYLFEYCKVFKMRSWIPAYAGMTYPLRHAHVPIRHTREGGYPKRTCKNVFMEKWIFDK
jgi:hypothetical protein